MLFFGQAMARFKPATRCRAEINCRLDVGDIEEGQIRMIPMLLAMVSSDLEVSLWYLWGYHVISSGDMDSPI